MSKACNLIGMILHRLALAHTCFHADIITDLLSKASLPQAEIDDAVDFMLVLIECHSGNGSLFKPDRRKKTRSFS
jgi:hypothetical protein